MRPFVRNWLCWLLAAMTLLSSASAQRSAPCGLEEGVAGCQPLASCCCPQDEIAVEASSESCCSCDGSQRAPLPLPERDLAKQPVAILVAPARAPPSAAFDDDLATRAFYSQQEQRSHAPLPRLTRQIAYSVWRL